MRVCRVVLVDDAGGFEKLREEWDELLESSAQNCLFLTWEWLYLSWKHLHDKGRLALLTVRSGRQLLAVAPMQMRGPELWRFMPYSGLEFLGVGTIGSDYLDIIVRRGAEGTAGRALADYLSRRGLTVRFVQLNHPSAFAETLVHDLECQGWRTASSNGNLCPYIDLAGHTWESFVESLGAGHRSNLRRRMKRLASEFTMRLEEAGSESQRSQALRLLITLHNLRWKGRGRSDAFPTAAILAFHEEWSRLALKRGWLRLNILWLDNRPAAALYGFCYSRRFYFYQSGFDPFFKRHSPGLVMIGLTIKRALEEGAVEYDMLHGDESYKFLWAQKVRKLVGIDAYPPGPRGSLCRGARRLDKTFRKVARALLK